VPHLGLAADVVQTFSVDIPAGSYHVRYGYFEKGAGLIGYFEVTSGGNRDIDFFIVDSENYQKFENGKEFSCYLLHEKVTSLNWTFRVPYSDTWYVVYSNRFSIITSKHVEGWTGVDKTPPEITVNLNDRETVSGLVTISVSAEDKYFDVYYLEIQIDGETVISKYNVESVSFSWDTTEYANGYHTITIIAKDNVGNSGSKSITVDVNNPIQSSSEEVQSQRESVQYTPATSTIINPPMLIFLVILIGAVVVVLLIRRKPSAKVEQSSSTLSLVPKQTVKIICPYCGAKNPSDAKFCIVCGASLEPY